MPIQLSRNELVKLTTVMAYWHNDHGDDEDASKLYDKLGELLEHAPGDK